MLQDRLNLSDAEWAVWTRAPSVELLWTFGALALVVAVGLALFAWSLSRRPICWRAALAGLAFTVPAAMLAAVFLDSAVQARGDNARCMVPGRAMAAGRAACTAGAATPSLMRTLADDDGFPALQYYWTRDGVCAARVSRACRVRAAPVAGLPPPGLERRDLLRLGD